MLVPKLAPEPVHTQSIQLQSPFTQSGSKTRFSGKNFMFAICRKTGGKLSAVLICTIFLLLDLGSPSVQADAGTWAATGSMITPRGFWYNGHPYTATLLANGQVLVAGGMAGTQPSNATAAAAELFNPATGT